MEQKAITAEQMRHYDSFTINTIGVPSLVLMERAALAVRDFKCLPAQPRPRCGGCWQWQQWW